MPMKRVKVERADQPKWHPVDYIPIEKFKEVDPQDFGKCKVCGREYTIYHVDGVCFDCHIKKRLEEDEEFRMVIEAWKDSYGDDEDGT